MANCRYQAITWLRKLSVSRSSVLGVAFAVARAPAGGVDADRPALVAPVGCAVAPGCGVSAAGAWGETATTIKAANVNAVSIRHIDQRQSTASALGSKRMQPSSPRRLR